MQLTEVVALERGDVELDIHASYEDVRNNLIIWEIQGATLLSNMFDLDPDEIYNEIVAQGKLDPLDQLVEHRLKSTRE